MAEKIVLPTHWRFQDLTGKVFGRLTVIEFAGIRGRITFWKCRCECGIEKEIPAPALKSGNTSSCGCLRNTQSSLSWTPEGKTWSHMIDRCYNPLNKDWKRCGGRGIAVYAEWRESMVAFIAYVGKRPTPRHSIDRYPNNDGDYEPGNVRWATNKEQKRNTRANRLETLNGQTLSLAEWAERSGINYQTVCKRLRIGWSFEKAITYPVRSW